jgi:hypothetical protein
VAGQAAASKRVARRRASRFAWATARQANYWIRSSTSQSNPLSAGRLRVRVPSDPPFYRSVAQSSERTWRCANTLGPRGRRWITIRDSEHRDLGHPSRKAWEAQSCRSDHFELLPWPNTSGIRLLTVIRYQSQLLPRRSYKPSRAIRIRAVKLRFDFRPVRFGIKPKLTSYECESC